MRGRKRANNRSNSARTTSNSKSVKAERAGVRMTILPERRLFLGLDHVQVFKLRAEDGLAVAAEPLVEQGRIQAAEVGVVLQVAVVEVLQAGVVADEAALHARTGDEEARAGAVVGSRAVFVDAAAE